jgi:hypothetical protein
MPYKIRKVYKQDCFKVYNPKTKKIYAKCTTRDKAKRQIRLLNAIEKNPKFRTTMRNKRN